MTDAGKRLIAAAEEARETARAHARIAELEAALQATCQREAEGIIRAEAKLERMRHDIYEASHPDFIFGAMDNVNDMDCSLTDFANAASRAIRAALGEKKE